MILESVAFRTIFSILSSHFSQFACHKARYLRMEPLSATGSLATEHGICSTSWLGTRRHWCKAVKTQWHYYCIHCVHSQRAALINAPNHVHVRTCQRVTAQTSYVQFLMKVRLWYQVITQAFSNLWTKLWNVNLLQKRRKLTLLKQLSRCTKVLCPFHSSTKSSRWLTS